MLLGVLMSEEEGFRARGLRLGGSSVELDREEEDLRLRRVRREVLKDFLAAALR